MMTVSDYLRSLRGRLESMRYEIDIYERIFGLKPNDPDASQQAMQGLQDRFEQEIHDIGVLKADNDRLQAEVERLQSRNAWLSGLETLTTTQQEELVEQRAAMQGLAEALTAGVHDGRLQTFEDRERWREKARAALDSVSPHMEAK